MASDTVQLGKLTIITELGCIIGSGQQAQIRIQEDHVQPRNGSLFIQYLDSKITLMIPSFDTLLSSIVQFQAWSQIPKRILKSNFMHLDSSMDN